jgi:hypothetical protein
MTKPHRLTPEEWETIELYAEDYSYAPLLELRARIEALEAAQRPPQDKLDRLIAQPQPEPVAPTNDELDGLFDAHCYTDDFGTHLMDAACFRDGARALLAQQPESQPYKLPEPVAPTESDVTELFYRHMGEGSQVGFENAIAEALARWGTPANTINQEDYDRD